MRSLKRLGASIVVLALFTACATVRPEPESKMLAGHNFSYTLANRESVGLIQAFDDGSKTYLHFREAPAEGVTIRSAADGPTLRFVSDGSYLIVPGVYAEILVSIGQYSARIKNEGPPQASMNTPPVARQINSPTPAPSPLRIAPNSVGAPAAPQEIGTLEGKISVLKDELLQAHVAGRGRTVFVRDVGGASRLVIRFEDKSSVVQIDDNLREAIAGAAKAASRIILHSRTDADTVTSTAAELAIARGASVKRFLESLGIPSERIRIFYSAAGDIAVANRTGEDNVSNRRVAIQLVKE
jgi:hypothetical protein